jgi:hypothetical protein
VEIIRRIARRINGRERTNKRIRRKTARRTARWMWGLLEGWPVGGWGEWGKVGISESHESVVE